MNNFELLNIKHSMQNFYASLIRKYTPTEVSPSYKSIINKYRSPCNNYLNVSSQNKRANEITFEALIYLIKECRICPLKERYKAIIILMYQIYNETSNVQYIDIIKTECIPYLYGGQECITLN